MEPIALLVSQAIVCASVLDLRRAERRVDSGCGRGREARPRARSGAWTLRSPTTTLQLCKTTTTSTRACS